ncbi:MAG: CopG family transcriptional regulator [Candidatus Methanomethylophilaceae archaeon]|nr:CopG family transcriptional regulator [Candidatus Methanomethylophilaceae archaeon]MDD3378530.1 CopG family transcriptional regulator [Candidatus Methanomethylophilaceae archaeon]MDY0224547.1 CopG family transcriptional regulator [Candidatus Methanomethylophilaceae archaeon]
MGIVSISLNDENLKALDDIQEAFGLNGRSEAVRTSINAAMIEVQDIKSMEGVVEGILIIVKKGHADPWMSLIQAKHEEDIKTQLHSHLKNHKCLEVMVISSDADKLSSMLREIHATGKADYVRFVRS